MYTGYWKMGFMHGLGKYTWGAFKNTRLVASQLNSFTGNFFEGRRLGFGRMDLASGATVFTNWYNREKTGNGEILCRNGNKIFSKNLFFEDRVVMVNLPKEICEGFPTDRVDDIEILNSLDEAELKKYVQPRTVDVNGPVHKMDFSMHIEKIFKIDCSVNISLSNKEINVFEDETEMKLIEKLENEWLSKVVQRRMSDLTKVYEFYAKLVIGNEPINFEPILLRVMLWQLLRDMGIRESGVNCAELDKMVGIGDEPFDKIMMYEMIHYLLTFCWISRRVSKTRNKKIPALLAGMFDLFIDEVVLKSMELNDGLFLKYLYHIPLKAVEKLFMSFGKPVNIEDICARLYYSPDKIYEESIPRISPYFKHVLQGWNAVTADGLCTYIPYSEPGFDLKKETLKYEKGPIIDFRALGEIGLENVVKALKNAVPDANEDGELIGDYQITFLDFCDILVNLAVIYLDLAEDYHIFAKEEATKEGFSANKEKDEKEKNSPPTDQAMQNRASKSFVKHKQSRKNVKSPKVEIVRPTESEELPSEISETASEIKTNKWRPKKFIVEDFVEEKLL